MRKSPTRWAGARASPPPKARHRCSSSRCQYIPDKTPPAFGKSSGVSVTSFSVAVDRDFGGRDGSDRQTDFIDCVAWRQTGEYISKYAAKGNWIVARGDFETIVVDEETRKRPGFMVKADRVKLLSLRPKEKETPDLAEQEAEAAKAVGQTLTDILSSVEPEVA